MDCEICGTKLEDDEYFLIMVEGAKMKVCHDCRGSGKLLHSINRPSPQNPLTRQARAPSAPKEEFELVEGFGKKMQAARNSMGLPLKVLAEKLAEKESFLDRVEKERTHPSIALAKRIEKELGIKLVEDATPTSGGDVEELLKKSSKTKGLTLGDILEIEKKKKK
ncbi:TIGR00270 family protein [Candidatus Micrarchaeota archaeon CG10_big_fil_rev_8_21_14_0_10_45_29]|nr:MAG: TIGR00270 family protein [Candidatus Micrarchaeota archaeon CG10_big_fil_rev_8_21_14_0_10_45_29]